MANKKKRTLRKNPIPKAKPVEKAIALRPGERRIPSTARALIAQLNQKYDTSMSQIQQMICDDLEIPKGTPVTFDGQRMTITLVKPEPAAKKDAAKDAPKAAAKKKV